MTTTSQRAITLDRNSLYIATQLIPDEDDSNLPSSTQNTFVKNAWHWSFFITDAEGSIYQHHWNVGDYTPHIHGEFYQSRFFQFVTTKTPDVPGQSFYILFAKISGWTNPGHNALSKVLLSIYADHAGKPPAMLRSQIPLISCRTWIIDALNLFHQNRWLVRTDISIFLSTVESVVKNESQRATNRYFDIVNWEDSAEGFQAAVIEI